MNRGAQGTGSNQYQVRSHDEAAPTLSAMGISRDKAKDTAMIQWVTEIKVRAERRAGEMLRQRRAAGR